MLQIGTKPVTFVRMKNADGECRRKPGNNLMHWHECDSVCHPKSDNQPLEEPFDF